ncbi:MAG: histidine phosphatase family protein [Myxococcota bacterium]
MKLKPLIAPIFATSLLACSATVERKAPVGPDRGNPLVVFLVRHAEKSGPSDDAPLTKQGQARAQLLARTLRSASIERIHSSNYTRTLQTAAPLARRLGLEVEHYNPRELATLIEKLRSTGGRHLVVGHSNTTPAAVRLLGGDGGSPIRNMEYDRLYAVTVSPQGETTSVVLRYGEVLD